MIESARLRASAAAPPVQNRYGAARVRTGRSRRSMAPGLTIRSTKPSRRTASERRNLRSPALAGGSPRTRSHPVVSAGRRPVLPEIGGIRYHLLAPPPVGKKDENRTTPFQALRAP